VLPNPARRYPLACGPTPDRIGVRVPSLSGALEPLSAARWPVLQSSANLSGGADPRRLGDVDPSIRAQVDMQLDGGELPGTPSSVVDLVAYEETGDYRVLREGAVAAVEIAAAL
jgi:L-threonylcarbamoyladenylate synthase